MTMRSNGWILGALGLAACMSEQPQLVASNCDKPEGCPVRAALHLDAVDILLVVDDSASIAGSAEALKAQLPRMLTAITTGSDSDSSFPPARSVHVAVTTTDMGAGDETNVPNCSGTGNDGVFVKPGEVGLACDVSYPGYLVYEAGPAAIANVDAVGCVPLVFSKHGGCGQEQPMEAALKSLWPSDNSQVSFLTGQGHGDKQNAGFLRDDSLLVVVVVTDEDDCSTTTNDIFTSKQFDGPHADEDVNLRCYYNQAALQPVKRYVDHLKGLRPNNDNVVLAVVGGVPTELVSDEFRGDYDFSKPAEVDAYYDAVLEDTRMQQTPNASAGNGSGQGNLEPSCVAKWADGSVDSARPPRRLVEIARGFGAQSVLASICRDDFGPSTGQIIRAIGEKLTDAARAD